jgi:hypothetical protein
MSMSAVPTLALSRTRPLLFVTNEWWSHLPDSDVASCATEESTSTIDTSSTAGRAILA